MLDKLEKKLGRYAVSHLIFYILGGYVLGYIFYILQDRIPIYNYIVLDPAMVMKGQVWRIFTWVLTPPQQLSFFVIFMFMFFYFIGRSLEENMGTFKYNLYMLSGWFFMTVGAMAIYWITSATGMGISMNVSTYYINMASFLAFAVLFPETRVYFFGIIPIKIKVLAWIDVGLLGFTVLQYLSALSLLSFQGNAEVYSMLSDLGLSSVYDQVITSYSYGGCITGIFSILISLLNFLVFFIATRKKRAEAKKRREEFRKKAETGKAENAAGTYAFTYRTEKETPKKQFKPTGSGEIVHTCCICGKTSTEYPDLQFRYCSKCSGNHEYCQEHLFTHEHIK